MEECQGENKFPVLEALTEVLLITGFTEVSEGSGDTSLETSWRLISNLVTVLKNRDWEGRRWV